MPMLTKIETKEIMTTRQAAEKYRDKYFQMAITQDVDGLDNDLGYVMYIYDCEREVLNIPNEEIEGARIGWFIGVAAEKGWHIGGFYFHGQD